MKDQIALDHIALQCHNKEKTIFFYQDILGLQMVKSFFLSEQLSNQIFDLYEPVEVFVFQNDLVCFEVFITSNNQGKTYAHTCLLVEDSTKFIATCNKNHIHNYAVMKGEKTLWFVKDFSGNVFEIKEKDL